MCVSVRVFSDVKAVGQGRHTGLFCWSYNSEAEEQARSAMDFQPNFRFLLFNRAFYRAERFLLRPGVGIVASKG